MVHTNTATTLEEEVNSSHSIGLDEPQLKEHNVTHATHANITFPCNQGSVHYAVNEHVLQMKDGLDENSAPRVHRVARDVGIVIGKRCSHLHAQRRHT